MYRILFLLLIFNNASLAQLNNVWCFGDSAGIDFNGSIPVPINASLRTRGSCASICDSTGNLLFYTAYDTTVLLASSKPIKIYNFNNQMVNNGDLIKGGGWYHELIIIPMPDSINKYYVFDIGVTKDYGLHYSIVDMNQNGGLGSVTQKNIQLMPDQQADCISAVKHGNGRDWWIIGRRFSPGQFNNEFWICLVTPLGVSTPSFQNIGSQNETGFAKIVFSPTGDTLLFSNLGDLLEMYDFDRCTGILTNPNTVRPQGIGNYEFQWGTEFSSNGRYIYASTNKDTCYLFQYDLLSPNPVANRDTLYSITYPTYVLGDLKRFEDGKIYMGSIYSNGLFFPYPYQDSIYNMYNMNLGVINSPDSLDTLCNFQPYSFYLGGKRTYLGLPNNPDYMLGPKVGSVCDTLTSITEAAQQVVISNLFPNPNSGLFTVNYFLPYNKTGKLKVINMLGDAVYEMNLPRFTYVQQVNLSKIPAGIYLVKIESDNKRVYKKLIKQ